MSEYRVWCPEYGQKAEDGPMFEARDAGAAAEGWADWSDSYRGDYTISEEDRCPTVHVQKEGTETVSRFIVNGYLQRCYSARAIVKKEPLE